jgi:ferrous iron transport protein A
MQVFRKTDAVYESPTSFQVTLGGPKIFYAVSKYLLLNLVGGGNMARLTELGPREIGIVVQVAGGHGLRQKLALGGIKKGSWSRLVSSSKGPIIVERGGGQIAIGRGTAQKVVVGVIR